MPPIRLMPGCVPPSCRCLLALCLAVLLGACATRPPAPGVSGAELWQRHRDALEQLDKWKLQGRIAVRLADKGWTASLDWRQDGKRYVARVFGPFGQGQYKLSGDDRAVRLHTDDGRLLQGRDAESLMRRNLGWGVPVSGFTYWIRGLPAPDSTPAAVTVDGRGLLQHLGQDGWQIDYADYRRSGGYELPKKITLRREDLQLKLIIYDWEA
ncbi:MAG: lipoprotein insertase outer membrane protein LolB [Gammaproteobacteria bacterium]